jgi:Zn-dependent membrane protease YugP
VYGSSSIAAVGIAATSAGTRCSNPTIQAAADAPAIVPVVKFGSMMYFPIFSSGLLASWEPLLYAGIICFAATLVFSLITLR